MRRNLTTVPVFRTWMGIGLTDETMAEAILAKFREEIDKRMASGEM